jgi:LysR family glycine cleavage system transcriptional activator
MAHGLPPLNALRAFEAGARHLSFTKAAEELHVTQAAISHQVKLLEQDLGVSLFRRMTRKLALTEEGRALMRVAGEALDAIAEAAERLRATPGGRTLTLSLTPTFGVKWLAHRLGRFWAAHPEIDLRLHHSIHLADFARDEVDAAVRWGGGAWPGVEAVYLMRAGLVPVCSPALLEGAHPLCAPADLRHHTLLHERDFVEWAQWLAVAGAREVEARRGPMIDDPSVLHQAAIDGHGNSAPCYLPGTGDHQGLPAPDAGHRSETRHPPGRLHRPACYLHPPTSSVQGCISVSREAHPGGTGPPGVGGHPDLRPESRSQGTGGTCQRDLPGPSGG